ncbi:MAG TPA: hypothetical protein VGN02_00730 [Paenibacillus sp.]
MYEPRFLRLLDRFQGIFTRLSIDYPVMRRILQVKLTMDARRVPTIVGKSKQSSDSSAMDERNQFVRSLWIYAIYGALCSVFMWMGDDYFFQMSLTFGVLMFIIMTSLISDFSSVLLDIRDRNILATKPVHRRTLAMAKALHVCIYLLMLTGAIASIPLVTALIKHGILFFLIFVIELIFMDLLIVALTALIYLTVLKFFDGEKLKDIINYVQIGLTIGMTIGYQLLSRMFNLIDMHVNFQPKWYQFYIIPVWFAAPFESVLHRNGDLIFTVFSLSGLILPVLAFIIYVRLMPSMERHLQKLADPGGRPARGRGRLPYWLSRIFCPSPQERGFFRLAWSMMGNERDFKLKVYPMLGFSIIFPFIFLLGPGMGSGISELRGTEKYLFIYFSGAMISTIIMMLQYSSKYKASWIYKALPISDYVQVYRGTLIAAFVRLIMPLFILQCVIFCFIFGIVIIPGLITAGLGLLLYTAICCFFLNNNLPFSRPFEAVQSEGMKTLPLMLLLGGFGVLHLVMTQIHYGVYIYTLLLIVLNFFVWHPNRKLFGRFIRRTGIE